MAEMQKPDNLIDFNSPLGKKVQDYTTQYVINKSRVSQQLKADYDQSVAASTFSSGVATALKQGVEFSGSGYEMGLKELGLPDAARYTHAAFGFAGNLAGGLGGAVTDPAKAFDQITQDVGKTSLEYEKVESASSARAS
jgi:hypothetical protein